MKKNYRIALLLITLTFLTTYSPHKFNIFPQDEKFFFKIQTIEITNQLQGNSEKRQISNLKTGLIHNMSAAGTSSSVMVLEN